MKYQIKNRWTGNIIYEDEAKSLKVLVEAAVMARADLSMANLACVNALAGIDKPQAWVTSAKETLDYLGKKGIEQIERNAAILKLDPD